MLVCRCSPMLVCRCSSADARLPMLVCRCSPMLADARLPMLVCRCSSADARLPICIVNATSYNKMMMDSNRFGPIRAPIRSVPYVATHVPNGHQMQFGRIPFADRPFMW
jgi:hypothetical protein